MTTFVLVHGGFGSPAELAPVIPALEALGHRAVTVDLPSTDPAALLEDYARTVVETIAQIEEPVVLVGHSAGGATISLVPDLIHVDRLVYVTAFLPEPGRSTVEPRPPQDESADESNQGRRADKGSIVAYSNEVIAYSGRQLMQSASPAEWVEERLSV